MPPAKKQKLSSNQPKPTFNTTSSSTSLPAPTSTLDLPYTSSALEDDAASEQGSEEGSDSEDEQDDASDESSEPDYETFSRHGRGAEEPDVDDEEEAPSAPLTSTALPSRIKLPSRVTAPKPKPSAVPSSSVPSALPLSPTAPSPPPTAPSSSSPTSSFSNLGISPALIASMGTMSIRRPTPIQAGCIPAILAGRDCIGIAQTGSGKTLAFALPILQRISRDPFGVWAVVLTPTRELAFQLAEQFHVLGVPLSIKTSVIVGGMDVITQAREMNGRPHVVVATPGRLVDLLRSAGGEWGLDKVQTLVLDEADRMLTPTFAADLAYLFSRIPAERQTCLFTATESDSIRSLETKPPRLGKAPIFVHKVLADTTTVSQLKQHYLFIPSHIRESYLYYLLLNPPESIKHLHRPNPNAPPSSTSTSSSSKKRSRTGLVPTPSDDPDAPPPWPPSTIIFTSRCQTSAHLHSLLTELNIPSVPLHSYLSQPERLRSLAAFRQGTVPVLIATDVGSRGLDIPEVAMVVNWDCPREGEDYVHRVGRTARAGRGGVAVTMVTERDTVLVERIEETIKTELTELVLPEVKVLEDLNKVSTAKRVAAMSLHDAGFGEKQKQRAVLEAKRKKRDAARKTG